MFKTYMLFFLLIILSFSCGNNNSSDTLAAQKKIIESTLPVLPSEMKQDLYKRCTTTDVIFYNLPVSMSQDDKYSVDRTISFMKDEAILINNTCKPVGRVSFLADGEPMLDADLFFGPDCIYFMIIEDGKPKYGNQMSKDGMKFFNDIISKFQG